MAGVIPYMDDTLYIAARTLGTDVFHGNQHDCEYFLRVTPGDGNNILHVAAAHGNRRIITAPSLLDDPDYARLFCQLNSRNQTPLHLAVEFGHLGTVEALLQTHQHPFISCNQRVNRCWEWQDSQGDTPLHGALRNGNDGVAALLLANYAQLATVVNNVGESPAYLAADNFCYKSLEIILDLLRWNQDVDSLSGPFQQTLFHPARRMDIGIMKSLLDPEKRFGPLRSQPDQHGKTVLHYAVEENREAIVKILLTADSSLAFMHDNTGHTPLHVAARMGSSRMIEIILRLSPQSLMIRTRTDLDQLRGQTALHVSKIKPRGLSKLLRNTRMIELINHADNEGNTPLHLALINNDLEIAFTLLRAKGINWRLRNNEGHSPMDLCGTDHGVPYHMSHIYIALRNLEVRQPDSRKENCICRCVSRLNAELESRTDEQLRNLLNNMAVAAALIVTITFAAPFTAPGGYDDKTGVAKLHHLTQFRVFMVSDMLAMLASITVLMYNTLGLIGMPFSRKRLALVCNILLQISLAATIIAFLYGLISIFPQKDWIIDGALSLPFSILVLLWGLIGKYVSLNR